MLYSLPTSQSGNSKLTLNTDDMYNANLLDLSYAVVDLETTGTRPITNQIIEIGIAKIEHGEIVDTFQTFLNPGVEIPPFISEMTGITDADVEGAPLFPDVIPRIMPYIEDSIFVAHNAAFDYSFLQKNLKACGVDFNAPKICTVQLSRKLIPQLPHHRLDDLVRHFHIQIDNRHRALDDAVATGKSLLHMFDILVQTGKKAFGALTDFSQPTETRKYKLLKPTIDSLPLCPGVYFMKNQDGQIIYVGKSKCLQKRVRSYFYSNEKKSRKIEKLLESVASIEYQTTGSELSALILESRQIKEHLPHFNTMIKNYKAYPFLKISNEAFPRLLITRDIKADGADYYGPFKSASMLKTTLEQLQQAFKIRPCKHKINPLKPKTLKTCMYYELGECPGVCGGKMTKEEYAYHIERLKSFLNGNTHVITKSLQKQIDELSENMEYEKAAEVRDQLLAVERINERQQKIAQSVKDNNVIIVQSGREKNEREIFCIKNGIVHSRFTAVQNGKNKDEEYTEFLQGSTLDSEELGYYEQKKKKNAHTQWEDMLNEIYSDKNTQTITKENIDELMIISTWLMQHQETRNTYFVGNNIQEIASNFSEKFILL